MPAIPKELLIRDLEGKITYLPLDRDRIMLGRSSACQLCYPDDAGLSRQHMALSKVNGQWIAEDLGSKNGTLVNDRRIEAPTLVGVGDKIAAGHLELSAALPNAAGVQKVEFVEVPQNSTTGETTLVASLDEMLGTQPGDMDQ